MPVNWKNYPKNWKAIALDVKVKAGWRCQNCGRPCREKGETWGDFEQRLKRSDEGWGKEFEKPVRFTLTVAHLNHDTWDNRTENLRALCSVCHLRYDAKYHAQNRRKRKNGDTTI